MLTRLTSITLIALLIAQTAMSGLAICLDGGCCHTGPPEAAPPPVATSCCSAHKHSDPAPSSVVLEQEHSCDDCVDVRFEQDVAVRDSTPDLELPNTVTAFDLDTTISAPHLFQVSAHRPRGPCGVDPPDLLRAPEVLRRTMRIRI